jgi:hypothetical protein
VGSDVYVFGGQDEGDQDNAGRAEQTSVFKYDTVADEWSTLAPMSQACASHSASVLDTLVYIVGTGETGRKVLRIDPTSGVWSTLAPTMNCRMSGASFVLGGCLYAAGGAGSRLSGMIWPATCTWAAVADMLEGHNSLCAFTIKSIDPAEEQDLFDSLIVKAARDRD